MATDWHCHECNTLHRYRCPAEVRATNAAKKK
jgi:hypothetical protein